MHEIPLMFLTKILQIIRLLILTRKKIITKNALVFFKQTKAILRHINTACYTDKIIE